MTVLLGEQRRLLSDVVVQAREVVEAACVQRIAALGVADDRAPAALNEADRGVRVGLRARARQLGSVDALVAEAGFEHWHRMLFARFLADNGLLIHPQYQVPVTMDEVGELAAETGQSDVWEVAAGFAAAMLPGIFRQDDPILAMRLPIEARQELERLLGRLPIEVITAEDSLGWVYQYWQTKRKDEVNKSERKIGGADLAPVTQLFTENYMVRFLLENSLGAWWAARHPDSPLQAGWEYLRRNDDGTPAVGGFDGWPEHVAEVTVMDPCCGSGHFLTAAFGMLWRMRAEEEEGLDPAAAQDAVIRDNLFGLELDPRCTQIATFALALEAWKAGGYRPLPLPNIACSGIPARAPLVDWLGLAGGDPLVEAALTRLHALFANADTLGSLIDPVRAAEQAGLESVDWAQVAPLVHKALTAEAGIHGNDPTAAVFGEAAAGIARAADYLSRTYTLVATNPPFLSARRASPLLRDRLEADYSVGARDTATAMLVRWVPDTRGHSATCFVTPHTWFYLQAFVEMRRWALDAARPLLVAWLGSGAFSSISGEIVNVVLGVYSSDRYPQYQLVDAHATTSPESKAVEVAEASLAAIDIPLVAPAMPESFPLAPQAVVAKLGDVCAPHTGLQTGDDPRNRQRFWEQATLSKGWRTEVSSEFDTSLFTGRYSLVRWPSTESYRKQPSAHLHSRAAEGRPSVIVRLMGALPATLFDGVVWHQNCARLVPHDPGDLASIWCFCSSEGFEAAVRSVDHSIKVTPASLSKVPFDPEHWRAVAAERYPNGLPEPFSDDPTQWLFKGVVVGSRHPLQVGVARLLGFRWPDQQPDDLDSLADGDGIVCIPALGGETTADERLRTLLANVYGPQWSAHLLDSLLVEAGAKPGTGLEKWLREGFFKDHCKVFANRPFIWQIWDGRPDGFSALVNYHKLDRKLLESLTYNYLGSWWVGRLNDEISRQIPGAEARLAGALDLKAKLELILKGEPPYDIYVRWKSLAEQPLGWDPDLDDGVRLNIRPFMTAGVLRAKPSIKWEKDRGKNPNGSERINNLHYTLAEKRAARGGGA